MMGQAAEAQSCDPQLIEVEIPSRAWGLDRLSAVSVDVHRRMLSDERLLTAHYWRLGRLLTLARKEFHRGQWALIS